MRFPDNLSLIAALPTLRGAPAQDVESAMRQFFDNHADLETYIRSRPKGLVAIDGRPGDGKTTLMRRMAQQLSCQGLDGDSFLTPKQRRFVGALRLDELRASVAAADEVPWIFLSTVCARQVVDVAQLECQTFIYVQPTSSVRLDHTRQFFDDDIDSPPTNVTWSPLVKEVEAYHATYKPRENADAVFLWCND